MTSQSKNRRDRSRFAKLASLVLSACLIFASTAFAETNDDAMLEEDANVNTGVEEMVNEAQAVDGLSDFPITLSPNRALTWNNQEIFVLKGNPVVSYDVYISDNDITVSSGQYGEFITSGSTNEDKLVFTTKKADLGKHIIVCTGKHLTSIPIGPVIISDNSSINLKNSEIEVTISKNGDIIYPTINDDDIETIVVNGEAAINEAKWAYEWVVDKNATPKVGDPVDLKLTPVGDKQFYIDIFKKNIFPAARIGSIKTVTDITNETVTLNLNTPSYNAANEDEIAGLISAADIRSMTISGKKLSGDDLAGWTFTALKGEAVSGADNTYLLNIKITAADENASYTGEKTITTDSVIIIGDNKEIANKEETKDQIIKADVQKFDLTMGGKVSKKITITGAQGGITAVADAKGRDVIDTEVDPENKTVTVTAKKAGTASITIKAAETNEYKASKAITVKVTVKPEKPAASIKNNKIKVTAGKKKGTAKITWAVKGGRNTTGYQIQYASKKSAVKNSKKIITVKGKKKMAATIKKLKAGKKVYVRVAPINTRNGVTNVGKWSAVKNGKAKK